MTGYQLFKQAALRVFKNLDDALAISGLIWIGAMAIVVLLSSAAPEQALTPDEMTISPAQLMNILAVNVTVFLASIWVAVAWHRFSLLGEKPRTLIPPLNLALLTPYFGKSVLLGLVMFGALIPLSIAISIVVMILGPLALLVTVFAGVIVYYIFLRFSPILPAAALGQSLSLSDAWRASEVCKDTLLQASVLSILLTAALQLGASLVGGGILGLLTSLSLGWLMLIVNVSLLSSIYEVINGKGRS